MEASVEKASDERGVKRYLETLDSSQLYVELMNPWEGEIALVPENRNFMQGELNARQNQNLENLKALRGMVLCNQKSNASTQKFTNYHDFRKAMVGILQKKHSLDMDFGKYREALREEEIRMKREKHPDISRDDQNIFFCQPASGALVFTGLKQRRRALEKIGKKVVYAEKQIKEKLEFPDEKTARDYIRGFARISDIARIRIVLTDAEKREMFMRTIYNALKLNGADGLQLKEVPYSHYNTVIKNSMNEYSPQDPVSFQVMGLYGFFEDLFGESCHTIYETRFKNKMYIPGGKGKFYEFGKKEQARYEMLVQRALDYLGVQFSST